MRLIKTILPLIIFAVVGVLLWRGLHQNPHVIASPLVGRAVPQFTALSLQNPQQTVTNAIFKNHVTVLSVFASWCVTCQEEHPILLDMQQTQHVRFVGLNYKDQRTATLTWLKEKGNPYTQVLYDPSGKVGIGFGVYGVPETFFIDKNGVVRDKVSGPITLEQWRTQYVPEIRRLEKG